MEEKTLGEIRIRTDFNPDNNDKVSQIKQKSAELINLIKSLPETNSHLANPECSRLKALAMTSYEEAAMWAVKAATA